MRKIIIIAAALFVTLTSSAQVGIIAGLTSSSTDYKTALATIKSVNQYHAGLTFKLGIGNSIAIQPSIIYNMKGQTVQQNLDKVLTSEAPSVDYKTGYLEVPVQLQVGIGLGTLARVYGFAEPFVGYAITNEVVANITSEPDINKTWDNIKNKLEYGVSLGVGVELFAHLQVSAKYFWNLGDVYGADINFGTIKTTIESSKCSGVAASVAYLF